jgi:uncharacterized protein
VRESLTKALSSNSAGAVSCYDLARDLAGSVRGLPQDLAVNPEYMKGFGQWTKGLACSISLLTCEPVLTEAAFLLKRDGRDADTLFELLERGVFRIALALQEEHADVKALMHRYRNKPMSLPAGEVFTLDSDFRTYRRHGSRVIPVLMPEWKGARPVRQTWA